MFSWCISKSAEAVFTRWAIKRLCKFLLKKKLGKFILGDIDLNQLDVQLSAGTIQLSDLALNVDYINEKLGMSPVLLKEGSIGSLMVIMPWKDGGCRIEVEELEVVLAPRRVKASQDDFEACSPSKNRDNSLEHGVRTLENETTNSTAANASVDVHEGVKTIAKMVKWLLTSFYVKIKKLIVAFDPLLEEENRKRSDRILVLWVSEAECGTHISEDEAVPLSSSTAAHNFLGLSRLTNFLKFDGAVLELLNMNELDFQSIHECSADMTSANRVFSGYCLPNKMTTVISGERGGFSGKLKLSLPWKYGSLDVCKVDAELQIGPLELRLQPCSIRCFIFMWDLFKGISEDRADTGYHEPTSNDCIPPGKGLGNKGVDTCSSFMDREPVNCLLSESHLISDWVSRSQRDSNEREPDFGASVDQFFECFDELRSSQSALGNSGMWNWTSSMFSAITAASGLASGSLQIPCEQQHVETNFTVAIEKMSLLLSFIDDVQKQTTKMEDGNANSDVVGHFVCGHFIGLSFSLQVYRLGMDFEGTVQHVQLVDHLCSMCDSAEYNTHWYSNNSEDIASIQKMQDGVQVALQTFYDNQKDSGTDYQDYYSVDISLSIQDTNGCFHVTNGKDAYEKFASVTLLKTSGVSSCHVRIDSCPSGASLMGPTSFTLKLPPFVFWVNFDLITMTVEFMKDVSNCIKTTQVGTGFSPESEIENFGSSPPRDCRQASHSLACDLPNKKILKGDIFLPYARIILSFPHIEHSALNCYSSCNQFIGFDFMSRTTEGKDVQASMMTPVASSNKGHTVPTSCTLNLNFGDLFVFSIFTPFQGQIVSSKTCNISEMRFSVEKIISIVNKTGDLATVSMFWQEGPTTGPWISKKANLLASSKNVRSGSKIVGKGCEFTSVTTVKDGKDYDSRTRQEILSSSSFLFHGQLPPVTINLDKSQYENLFGLLSQLVEHFSSIVSESVRSEEEHPSSQAAFLVEFDSMTVCISVEPVDDVKCTLLSEFPGSWRCLTLKVDSFELFSVSHIGGTRNSNFLWVSHGPGNLWGSITKELHQEFLLISCSESAGGRGDGEGSNVLSSRCAGSDIIKMWDPESKHYHSSVTIRCATIVAMGGRLDWFKTIFSFFDRSSADSVQADDNNLHKTSGSSFMLNLEDVGLSYEPYLKTLAANQGSNLNSCDPNLACLLAASSVKLSNTSGVDCTTGEYKIMLQDLGLLIHKVVEPKLVGSIYSVEHLRKIGYVKVAQEDHVEALLKTKADNGYAWELECQESHIMLNTCHDTTSGLVRLAAQLQNLFAPDMQDYIVHLENRWNNSQKGHGNRDEMLASEFSESHSHTEILGPDKRSSVGNLMDEIHEDVFELDGNTDGQTKLLESNPLVASGASLSEDMVPTFIEEYFLQDLHPLSGLGLENQSYEVLGFRNGAAGEGRIGNDGWYADSSLRILENHASKVEQTNKWKSVECEASTSNVEQFDVGKAEGRITFKNMNVTWRMYGGSDWSNFQDTGQASLTCGRDATACLELSLSGIEFDYDAYPAGEISASRISLAIQDICLNDRSDDAPWKLVLGYYQSKKHPRNLSTKAVKLNLEAVRPDPSLCIEENRLQVSLLPIRLHLHQSQLDFLIRFFGGQNSTTDPTTNPSLSARLDLSKSGVSFENHEHIPGFTTNEEAFLTYFQKFDIWPLLIRVDYSPCRVDLTALRDGKYVELVNLVPWKGVELQLKHVQGVGLYGWSKVCETILGEWLEDISQNQIHKLLKGLPPIKSLVAVGSGAAKLVSLPVKSYRKDHRLLKGMQRGTFAFLRSISLEAIGLGVHLAAGAHNVLLQAESILASIPPSVPWPVESQVGTNVKSNQPADAQQGIQQACQSISDGLGKSASALVQNPLKRYQRGAGMGSALATAVQSAPAAAIAPASASVRAVHCALLGLRNSLDPERKNESLEKYMGRTPSQKSME